MNRPALLCTFTQRDELQNCVSYIKGFYDSTILDLEVYGYTNQLENVVCIYNISQQGQRISDTITINKKKQTTTFYTINALNALIKSLNNGVLDMDYKVNWANFQFTLVLSDKQDNCRLIPIERISNY